MKALIVYDATGRIWNVTYGESTVPNGLSSMLVDVPDGQNISGVDLSGSSPSAIFEVMPQSEVQRLESAILELSSTINNMYHSVMPLETSARFAAETFTDEQALQVKELYTAWGEFIGKELKSGKRVRYGEKLYKVRQDISEVLENQPPSIDTAALYEEIVENHEGTIDDPIPYNNNMELFEGKYYTQYGVVYECTRNTEQAVYQALADLVGIYVEIAE